MISSSTRCSWLRRRLQGHVLGNFSSAVNFVKMLVSEPESVACGNQQPGVGGGCGGGGSGHSSTKEESLQEPSLTRQNSVFSLTLDEIQCKSGKSFGSMNMDEFLASVWSVEENQSQSIQDEQNSNLNPNNKTQPANTTSTSTATAATTTSALARQGSLTIPISLCRKTVDEVWFEIHKENQQPQQEEEKQNSSNNNNIQRQQTLGEITLEDFLIKAGVVQEPVSATSLKKMQVDQPIQEQHVINHDSYGNQMDGSGGVGVGFVNCHQNAGNGVPSGNVNGGFAAYQVFAKSGPFAGEPSIGNGNVDDHHQRLCRQGPMDPGGLKNVRKRIIDGPPEVVVERRQRRMIKNRESAARSRARRQAYTVELELELNQLKEENSKLKQTLEDIEQKRKEEVMKRKQSNEARMTQNASEKLGTIRKTMSLGW